MVAIVLDTIIRHGGLPAIIRRLKKCGNNATTTAVRQVVEPCGIVIVGPCPAIITSVKLMLRAGVDAQNDKSSLG